MLNIMTVPELVAVSLVELHERIKSGKDGKKGLVASFKLRSDKRGWKPGWLSSAISAAGAPADTRAAIPPHDAEVAAAALTSSSSS